MKYIMFRQQQCGMTKLIPVIFPNDFVHKDVADALQQTVLKDSEIHSAGFISPLNLLPEGRSETLNVAADPDTDERVIKMNDYGAAWQ
ncbi:hypothetical protein [Acinetobacter sp. ANC 4204]|uniref:hypothetical protein n=1 Tax=Acinetobacter sp. ANC 4204 TaxID=1977884 RepID=UPI00111C39C2|nr:hypothetical protein [Acinetobacter sp. ANC 4204]